MEAAQETTKKKDFVEIEFAGKANGELFDTNIPEKIKEMNPNIKEEELREVKPLFVCVGQEMLLSGFDEALEGKEIGKEYKITLLPEKAFGKREPKLIKVMPIKLFLEKKIQPAAGMTIYLDNFLVKIISVSGGRVIVDFNNPLAGKTIEYDFKILRKVDKTEEKINALMDFFFKKRFEFSVEDKKLVIKAEKNFAKFIDMHKEKFKEIIGLEFEIREVEKKEESEKIEKKEVNKTKQK